MSGTTVATNSGEELIVISVVSKPPDPDAF